MQQANGPEAPRSAVESFDPTKFLSRVNGNEYLEVKWRLVWLRDRDPDAQIETEMVVMNPDIAICRAVITLTTGGRATGHGSETPNDFKDHYEKAETKAMGRALAALGFGTQFAPDHDFGQGSGRVVDAPVSRGAGRPPDNVRPINQHQGNNAQQAAQQRQGGQGGAQQPRRDPSTLPPPEERTGPSWEAQATHGQVKFAWSLLQQAGFDPLGAEVEVAQRFGVQGGPEALNKRDCGFLIEDLKRELGLD